MADSQNDLELPDLGQPEASAPAQSGAPNPAAAARTAAGVRTLEEILWAAANAYGDPGNTAFIDREEFAAQIFSAWEGEVPCEAFISRFFDGPMSAEGGAPQSMAEAVARAARSRLNAYEFDLNQLEYVVIEDKEDFIIVSSAGEFALPDSSVVRSSILDAVISDDGVSPLGKGDASVDRSDKGQPRAFLVKRNGDIVAVDVMKLAGAIKTSQPVLRTADTPLADRPSARLQPFIVRRRSLTESREVELLKRDRRVSQWDGALPSNRRVGGMDLAAGGAGALAAPPAGADQTILLLMPDGTLARPVIGAASRWQEMVNEWVGRAAVVSLGATSAPQAVLPGQTFMVQSDRVVSIFTNGGNSASSSDYPAYSEGSTGTSSVMAAFASYASSQGLPFGPAGSAVGDGFPGSMGRGAEAQAQAITSVRLLQANVRELSEDALAEAVARGAKLLGGLSTPMSAQGLVGNAFWIQPEVFFAPTAREQADAALDLAQSGSMSRIGEGTTRQLVAQGYNVTAESVPLPGTPLQLGQVTGDPWADWALATGGQITESDLAMPALMARIDRSASPMSISAAEAFGLPPGQSLEEARHNIKGGRVIAFRAPDGTLVVQAANAVHLAEAGRVVQDGSSDAGSGQSRPSIGFRSGAVPQSALNTLATALERTAAAGGYKLPQVRILSAPDALERGEAMSAQLDGGSSYRQSVRLAGTTDVGDGGQVARMVLSMPFPSSGELVVGSDLSEALQSLLSAPAVPMSRGGANAGGSYGDPGAQGLVGDGAPRAGSGVWLAGGALGGAALGGLAGAIALRGGGSGGGPVMGPDGQFLVRGGGSGGGSYGSGPGGELVIDLGGQHQQARASAQEALTTFEMPDVAQSLASQSSFSGLPILLRRALAESGDWAPGAGTPLPASVRQLVMSGPFDLPELVTGDAGSSAMAAPPRRQVNPGQEEIVIPMPLWAQMGRGQMSETQDILASPRMPKGFQPPLGYYRLVAPSMVDMTGGASEGPGVSRLSGPTHMMIDVSPRGGVSARSGGGDHQLARMSSDAADAVLSQRRMKIGAPLSAAALAAVMSKRRTSGPAPRPTADQIADMQSQAPSGRSRSGNSYGPVDSGGFDGGSRGSMGSGFGGGEGSSASGGFSGSSGISGSGSSGFGGSGVGKIPSVPNINLPDAASILTSGGGSAAGGGRTMAGALQSAMRMSDAVDSRMLPASASPGSVPSFGSGFPGGAPGVLASPSRASSGMSTGGISTGGSSGGFGSFGGASGGVGGGDTYILGGSNGGGGGSVRVSAAAGNAPSTSNIISSAQSSSSSAVSTRWGEPGMAPGGRAPSISVYQLGGGAAASAGGMGSWDFSGIGRGSSGMTGGSSDMGSLRREALPSLPTALRFRYAGAPLWWSSGGSSSSSGAAADDAGDDDESSEGESRFGRRLGSALRAANSAATLWRSILVHPSGGGQGAQQQGGSGSGSDAGGMDRSWDDNASSMSALDGKLAILALGAGGGAAAGAGAVAGKGAESVYIAMDNAGRAGTVSGKQAGSSKLDSLSMSIVAAVPPAPPPLESMGSGSGFGGTSAQAHYEPRAKKHGAGHGHEGGGKSADEGTSHSKIEGSVDAIAQRIYHRIRRRIASDRERFGG
jgi:hypothetical protein